MGNLEGDVERGETFGMPVRAASAGSARNRSVLAAVVAALLVAGLSSAHSATAGTNGANGAVTTSTQATAGDARPNIVLITADDMRKSDLAWMPQTRRLLRDAGVQVHGFLSNHPLCCPARAEILTGQYGQNNGVLSNRGPGGGYSALRDPDNHVGTWLQQAGYKTAMVGKHLNGWEDTRHHQRGWTVLDPTLRGVDSPYDITMYNNGNPQRVTGDYTADLMGQRTVRYINRFSASGSPFFIWTSQLPPHGMRWDGQYHEAPMAAPRHRTLYAGATSPSVQDPAYNEANVSDKPRTVAKATKLSTAHVNDVHRARIRSLRAVDDQVKATVDALRSAGELSQTYIVFTSDNGYLMGEHRLMNKNHPYEQSITVPLLARGPGLAAGTTRNATYSMVDLAPTFADLAGVTPGRAVDGRTMAPTLRAGAPGYRDVLIQSSIYELGTEWWWRGIRSDDFVYVRWNDGFEELYDRHADPAQLRNVAGDPAYASVRTDHAARLGTLQSCTGTGCQS